MEFLILGQVRNAIAITIRVPIMPIRRRADLELVVFRLAVQGCVAVPRNTVVGHDERLWRIATLLIDSDRTEDGVIEDGVGDQSAGVVSFVVRSQLQWIASAAVYRIVTLGLTFQLIGVQRLDVSSVVLVEVCKPVV